MMGCTCLSVPERGKRTIVSLRPGWASSRPAEPPSKILCQNTNTQTTNPILPRVCNYLYLCTMHRSTSRQSSRAWEGLSLSLPLQPHFQPFPFSHPRLQPTASSCSSAAPSLRPCQNYVLTADRMWIHYPCLRPHHCPPKRA